MSGWRKRTIMEMAREAGFEGDSELTWEGVICTEELERFAALVRADERGKFLGVLRQLHDSYSLASDPSGLKEKT
jgi:hypothetical protein